MGDEHTLTLQHSILTHRGGVSPDGADATVAVARSAFNELFTGTATIGRLTVGGPAGRSVGPLLVPSATYRFASWPVNGGVGIRLLPSLGKGRAV